MGLSLSRAPLEFFSRSYGEGDEGHEAREQCGEGRGDAEGRALFCDRVHLRDQEEGCEGGLRCPGGADPGAAEGGGEVCHPRDHHDQAEEEAGDEGREADGLRQGGVREGEAREDPREGLHGEGAQRCLLSCAGSLTSAKLCGVHERRLLLGAGLSRSQFERWALRFITLMFRGWITLYATDL